MPTIPRRIQQQQPVSAQVELPPEFPSIPDEILARFPSAEQWQKRLDEFWTRTNAAIQGAQEQVANQANARVVYSVDSFRIYGPQGVPQPLFSLDGTGVRLGDVLVINTVGRKVYIGEGVYQDAGTPFYIDTLGKFSLGANLTWDPDTSTLTITGIINATSGTIGGFTIGADYIRDVANSMGLASTVTGGDDVRFWAGDTFANRATAPFRVTEAGILFGTKIYASNNALGLPTNPATNQYMVHLGNTNGVAPAILIDGSGAASLLVLRRAQGTLAAPSAITSGTLVGTIGAMGYGDTGFITTRTVELNFLASETWTDTVWGSRMEFKVTAVGAATLTTAARLDSNGFNATAIGGTTPAAGAFTTLSATGVITSTLATGTAPFTIASTTVVGNLNVSQLLGGTWAIPGAIGATTPNAGTFTDVTLSGALKLGNAAVAETPTPTHTVTLKDSTGAVYRVPCLV